MFWTNIIFNVSIIKDAKSASWYPYNWKIILQYIKPIEWINIAKGIKKFHDKQCVDKKVKTQQQQNTKSNIKSCPEPGIEPGTSRTQVRGLIYTPPSQLKVSIVVKPFNCFNAMGRNINK